MDSRKVITSMIYKFSERLAVKGMGLVIGIILARLLLPEDFGQVAIITVFINLATEILQGGLNTALVQQKDITEDDYSTVFYLSLSASIILFFALYFSAPLIADFYDFDNLIWPIRVYAFSLIFGAFNSVQVAKIQREMRFRAMMWASLIATVLSGVIGVALAYAGYGIWALVAYGCSATVLSCITMMFFAKWFPRPVFSLSRAKVLFSYGWKMLVSAMLCSIYADIRSLIIGKHYSTEDLAYYDRGQQYPYILSHTLDTSIQSVMFPTLSRSQSSVEQMRSILSKTISISAFIIIPTMVGLSAVSELFIVIILTDKWLPAVPYMSIICLGFASIAFSSSSLIAIKATGKSDIYMKLEIFRRALMLLILLGVIFVFDSVLAIAISYALTSWMDLFIISVPLKRLLNYSFLDMIKENWKSLLSSLLMGILVLLVGLIPLNNFLLICMQVFVGVIVYASVNLLLKNDVFTGIIKLVKSFFKKA